jgi:hypothetical protein
MSTVEQLLENARTIYRRDPAMNAPGEYQRAAGEYQAALAAVVDIPERQRKNVYDQTLYAGASLTDAIDAAIWRETTRVIRIDSEGLRVETVRELCSDHSRVEVYDTATGDMIASMGGIPAAQLERTATDLFTEVWQHVNAGESECDGCLVRPDGTNENGAICPCATQRPVGGCRCRASLTEWHGPAYIRAEIVAEQV